ncbi:polymeric immunoglobulin receptor-like [Cinclus cinclus]|uniref:polymeric immunoglobulin receptor-like n=1 Tax=Cinclus cinclus TaxID=127875 RepID=UPI002E12CF23
MAMELRALILLPLCFPGLQGQTPEAQRRREGDTLHIQCSYAAWTTDQNTKYWCLWKDGKCQELVHTHYEYTQTSKDGRTQIKDDTTNKTVSITMTNLKADDSGRYFCAYHMYYNKYVPIRMISLNVFKELLMWELDTLSVQCPNRYGMVWCQRRQTGCTVLVERPTSSRRTEIKPLQDRASIEYNAQGTLTVTMKKLQTRDSGVYWCALDSGLTRTSEVMLSVFKRTQRSTAKESGHISVQCHYKIADYRAVTKAWCKMEGEMCNVLVTSSSEPPAENGTAREGVRMQDDSQQGIVTVTMEQLQLQDSGVYWCALLELSGLSRVEEVTLSVSRDNVLMVGEGMEEAPGHGRAAPGYSLALAELGASSADDERGLLSPGGFPDNEKESQDTVLSELSSSENTFIILSVVLLILLLLSLVTSTALGVRYYKLLVRTGNREAEDMRDRPEDTAQPGSTGRRESSQDDSKGSGYINLDVQSHPILEDPLYCNVEPSQAHRNPQCVEYAVIAFNQSPGSGRE